MIITVFLSKFCSIIAIENGVDRTVYYNTTEQKTFPTIQNSHEQLILGFLKIIECIGERHLAFHLLNLKSS